MNYKYLILLYNHFIIGCGVLIIMFFLTNLSVNMGYAQSQSQNSNSIISNICKLAEQNAFLATITGNSEPLAICRGVELINSNQTLYRLCSAVESIPVINTAGLCEQAQPNQTSTNNSSIDNLRNISRPGDELLNGIIGLFKIFT